MSRTGAVLVSLAVVLSVMAGGAVATDQGQTATLADTVDVEETISVGEDLRAEIIGAADALAQQSSPTNDSIQRIGFDYVNQGGSMNIEINGDRVYDINSFAKSAPDGIDGRTIGGVSVNVTRVGSGPPERGHVELSGQIDTFAVGGQETSVDNIEFGPSSNPVENVTFDSVTPSKSQYVAGDSPVVDGVQSQIIQFTRSDGSKTSGRGGSLNTGTTQPPGGSSPSFFQGNTNIWFNVTDIAQNGDGDDTIQRIGFDYVNQGGSMNIEINGDRVYDIGSFAKSAPDGIDGRTIGGVSASVTRVGSGAPERGHVELSGQIDTFAVGGQETSVDNIEFGPSSNPVENVTFDTLTPSKSQYVVGDSPTVDGVPSQIIAFTFTDGTQYTNGDGSLNTGTTQPPGGSSPSFFQGNTNIWFNVTDIAQNGDGGNTVVANLTADGDKTVEPGGNVSVTYNLTNLGNTAATGGLQPTYPPDLSVTDVSGDGTNQPSRFFTSSIQPGSSVTATYTFSAASNASLGTVAIDTTGTLQADGNSDTDLSVVDVEIVENAGLPTDPGEPSFQEVLAVIEAFNDGEQFNGADVSFQDVLAVIEAFNEG